jgi:recombination protein RecA
MSTDRKGIIMAANWMTKLGKIAGGKPALDLAKPTDSVITLPSPSLNYVVGNNGITRGKAAVLYGPESGGKSLLSQLIIKQLLIDTATEGGLAIWFDAEFSFNPSWWLKLCDNDESIANRLMIVQSNNPIDIFDNLAGPIHQQLQDGMPLVGMCIDSVKSILYPKDRKAKTTDLTMGGGGASYLGPALKLILPVIRQYSITTLLVQQVYEEMDANKKLTNPFIVPDGRSLRHFADYMLEITRLDTKKGRLEVGKNMYGGAQQIGHIVRVRGKKNRVGAPFRTGQFTLSYTGGIINQHDEIFDLAKALGVIEKPTAMSYQYGKHEAVKGEQNMREWLKQHPELYPEIIIACDNVSEDAHEEHNSSLAQEIELNLDDL